MQQRLMNEFVAEITNDITDDVHLSTWVSFAEIYNESIYDLLIPEPPRGKPRKKLQLGQCHGNTYIKDLTCINVCSGVEAYQILQHGLLNLRYAATSINDRSSRSHSIFTIKLVQASNIKKGYHVSAFNFCDLAGSERMKKTHNMGDRLKESININTSLLVLGRCVSLIREFQKENLLNKPIPFRDSKLTRLFQRALLGHELISMIVNINTTRNMFQETQHALNFSAIAKDVNIVQQSLFQYPSHNRFSGYMEQELSEIHPIIEEKNEDFIDEMLLQITELTLLLEKQKSEAKEDRDYIISTYKNLLKETTEFWEKRCKKWEEKARQNRHTVTQALNGKTNSSVICLDSSSSSDEENMDCSFITAQNEIVKLKDQLQEKEEYVKSLTVENAELTETLKDAVKAYKELEMQSGNTVKQMQKQLIQQEDQINALQEQVDYYSGLEYIMEDCDEVKNLLN